MRLPTFCCTTYNIDDLRAPSQPLYAQSDDFLLVGGTSMPSDATLAKLTVRRYEHAMFTGTDPYYSFSTSDTGGVVKLCQLKAFHEFSCGSNGIV